ncbi:MAG TPA: dihydropteroate synthase, partial [Gammaproteobacteria bacterium]|nr:dihydropteroate synthase [Gammaproteobacteria bacterium]
MAERILFITGKLAEKSLRRTLAGMSTPPFEYEVRVLGVTVAALLTGDLIQRRLDSIETFDRILIPGRCRGDLASLSAHFGIPVERGPEELKDLPGFFGVNGKIHNLDNHDMLIFAELVDAPHCSVNTIVDRALEYQEDGADVIDIGCLPDIPFPHLEET